MTARFAIYAVPGAGSADPAAALLREQAERWLGRSVSGDPVTPGVPAGWTRDAVDAITVSARRYGFHGTLKAPFYLAPGRTPEELDAALAQFATGRERVLVPRLRIARLGGFFALIPGTGVAGVTGVGTEAGVAANAEMAGVAGVGAEAGVHALADAVVTGFDGFRAAPTEGEIARRDPASLTSRQRELLEAWGYPYVLDEFRFHLTVTDRIPVARQFAVEAALSSWFGASLGATVPIDALALCTEAEAGAPFTLRAVHPLRPAASTPTDGAVTTDSAAATDSEGAR